MNQITLPGVMEIINKWSNKVAGCGNGRAVLERMIQELNETYGN
tara:strand:+ start:1081 stop:1212 length:132 start_codon:yes stop_codon:yes gene_type:complete